MKYYIYNLILALWIFSYACNSARSLKSAKIQYVAFGGGGGFTGIETKYILKRNGKLLKISNKDTTFLKRVRKSESKVLINALSDYKSYQYVNPDNIYRFIEISHNRIVWGLDVHALDSNIIRLYRGLSELLK